MKRWFLCVGGFSVAQQIVLSYSSGWVNLEALLRRYSDRPISLADACLIRRAEIHEEARVFTLDSDFGVYRWGHNKRFQLSNPDCSRALRGRYRD
jgi:predicted nucleic acid-binding protein